MKLFQTAERHSSQLASDHVMHQRHMIAYDQAAKLISGKVLEIGSGEGYGLKILAPLTEEYHAVDKFKTQLEETGSIRFYQMNVPPLVGIQDNYFDYVVSFQVIEHIPNDELFLREIYRVLKPGGKVILTTPNLEMSLTRNPWHVREYQGDELKKLSESIFDTTQMKGVYGTEAVMSYYEANKKSVQKFTRFDILKLQYRLPRRVLQIPYDILNRINRNSLHKQNKSNIQQIQLNDYFLDNKTDACFDFFVVASKQQEN